MLSLGFVLELPWDIGVPSGFVVPSWVRDSRTSAPARAVCEATRTGEPPTAKHTLAGWIEFQTVTVAVQLPLAASDLAFGYSRVDIPNRRAQRRLKRRVDKHVANRGHSRRTVALVSVVVATIGEGIADAQAFDRALDLLNAWLVSLGVSLDMRLRPLNLGDLPEWVPYMPTEWHDDGTYERGLAAPMRLRHHPKEIPTHTYLELERAADVLAVMSAQTGLATFYEIVQRAGSSMSSHRYREAVIDYTTAGEIFITEMYREIALRREVPKDKLTSILTNSLTDRARHLSRLLGHAFEPEDPNSIVFYWWLHCYLQRNPIVHAGRDSIEPLAELARLGLAMMVVDVREAFACRPRTPRLVRAHPMGLPGRRDRPREGLIPRR